MKLTLLNHASCIFEFDDVSILCDPWLDKIIFNEGWGLKWKVDFNFKIISNCKYLWISNFHEDHLHKKLYKTFLK